MSDIHNIKARDAWQTLAGEGGLLVDVRTRAEWHFVGVPDLGQLGSEPLLIEWQSLPDMQVNPGFVEELAARVRAAGGNAQTPLFFLCRSGQRSLAAARAMQAAGFSRLYNISDGFEGPLDEDRHRNTLAGWRAAGLPWVQS